MARSNQQYKATPVRERGEGLLADILRDVRAGLVTVIYQSEITTDQKGRRCRTITIRGNKPNGQDKPRVPVSPLVWKKSGTLVHTGDHIMGRERTLQDLGFEYDPLEIGAFGWARYNKGKGEFETVEAEFIAEASNEDWFRFKDTLRA